MLTFTEAASASDARSSSTVRDGDYIGAAVNLASRVADEAGRHHVAKAAPVTLRHEHL